MTYKDFSHLVAQVGGVSPPKIAAQYWMLYPFALGATPLDLLWPNLFGNFNLTVLRTGFCEHFVSSEKSRRQLGVELRPIEQAVADTLSWFEQNGYLQRTADGWRIPPKSKS